MEKRFMVKRFLFETKTEKEVCRFMRTDLLVLMLVPNQYIEMKSVNKLGIGKDSTYELCIFFDFLHERYSVSSDIATNKQVVAFIDHLVYGHTSELEIADTQESLCSSTLSAYIKWYTEEETALLSSGFLTLRDEAVF